MRDAKLNSVSEICISLVVLKNNSNVSYGGGALMLYNGIATLSIINNLACIKAKLLTVSSYKL